MFSIVPTMGVTYYFAVRAVDTSTQADDGNTNVVAVVVSDGTIIPYRYFRV